MGVHPGGCGEMKTWHFERRVRGFVFVVIEEQFHCWEILQACFCKLSISNRWVIQILIRSAMIDQLRSMLVDMNVYNLL